MNKFSIMPTIYSHKDSLNLIRDMDFNNLLIITDKVMNEIGMVNRLKEIIGSSSKKICVYDEVLPDPSISVVTEGMEKYIESNADLVIALGGGSVIDASKAILYSLYKANPLEFKKPKFIAIPTTSGTGSEVTSFSVITMGEEKICLVDDWMCPDIAILDSELVKTVPKNITADTGMDVLVHALEAYVSPRANDYTDAFAEKAISIVFNYLLDAYRNGDDIEARQKMHDASCMAGVAFTNAGLGINHSLAHALGANFHIAHGKANALLVNHVINYNIQNPRACEKYAQLSRMMRIEGKNNIESSKNLMKAIQILKNEMKMPKNIMSLNINREDYANKLDQMALSALEDGCTVTNPVSPSKKDLMKIYVNAFKGGY